jgi:CheY-like chemotaxis protein
MNAPCVDAVFRLPLPFLLGEVSERFDMDIADLQEVGGPTRVSEHHLGTSHLSYQALASKKPPAKPRTSRKGKGKETDPNRRGAVLVVDDVPDVTEMIELLLKHAGYDVSTAESAQDALHLARLNHYDLVISDIGMPDMNGYELASALRELAAYNKTPLIAVTGYSEYDDRGRAVRAGFNVHLTKPIEPTQLLTLMRDLLSQTEPGNGH